AVALPRGLAEVRASVLAKAVSLKPPLSVALKAQAIAVVAPALEVLAVKKVIAVALLLVTTLTIVNWGTQDPAQPTELDPTSGVATPVVLVSPPAQDVQPGELVTPREESQARRLPAAAPAEVTGPHTGSLRVRVVDSQGAPVAGEIAIVRPAGSTAGSRGGWSREWKALSDAGGLALFEELPAGFHLVDLLRGGREDVRITEGEPTSILMQIVDGIEVQGEVVDRAGRGVAHAEIWVYERWGHLNGHALTRADRAGRFSLRAISKDHYIAAQAPGYAASYLQQLRAKPGERIDVRIRLDRGGGRIEGRVVDGGGAAVAGAQVLVDEDGWLASPTLPGGRTVTGPAPRRALTDEAGRFEVVYVGLGAQEIQVRAPGFSPARRALEVGARGVVEIEIRLRETGRITGRVTAGGGRPVHLASVFTEPRYTFGSVSTVTDAEGHYELADLPAGEILVGAQHAALGAAQATLDLAVGETRRFDFELERGPRVFGTLHAADGEPLAGWAIDLREDSSRALGDACNTDAEGAFQFSVDASWRYTLIVRTPGDWRQFPRLTVSDVRAADEPLVLNLPREALDTATLLATVVDPDGQPAAGARLEILHEDLQLLRSFDVDRSTGELLAEGIPEGTLELSLKHDEHPMQRLESVTLRPGEVRDLGQLRFERSGLLRGELSGLVDDSLLDGLRLQISRVGGVQGTVHREGRSFHTSPLSSGEYQLTILGDFVKPIYRTIAIREGEESAVQVELERAGLRVVRIDTSQLQETPRWIGCNALDSQGRFVWSGPARRLENGIFEARVSVVPGDYRLIATAPGDRSVELDFSVSGWDGEQEPVLARLLRSGDE
ncbi:MAG: carboxypeptidase-like regulatory domain-containing protein, partial [Planctomycetota bacterium]